MAADEWPQFRGNPQLTGVAPAALPANLKFLTPQSLPLLFDFPRDMARVPAQPNRLSNQQLVTTYEKEWGKVLP